MQVIGYAVIRKASGKPASTVRGSKLYTSEGRARAAFYGYGGKFPDYLVIVPVHAEVPA